MLTTVLASFNEMQCLCDGTGEKTVEAEDIVLCHHRIPQLIPQWLSQEDYVAGRPSSARDFFIFSRTVARHGDSCSKVIQDVSDQSRRPQRRLLALQRRDPIGGERLTRLHLLLMTMVTSYMFSDVHGVHTFFVSVMS